MFTFAIKSLRTPQFGRLTAALLALCLLTTTARAHPDHDETAGVANTLPPSGAKPENAVTITTEGEYRIIKSNGWPDHAPGAFPRRGNPNTVAAQNYTFRLPLKPKIADALERRGGWWWGVALNGVPFEPGTAETWNNDPRSGWRYEAATGFLNLGLDAIVGEALKFIGAAAEKKTPFFAVVWFGSPHVTHAPLPADLAAAGGSGYYGELIAVDRSLGTLRAGLRKLGIADNTMLWFSSDNGGWHDPKKPDGHGTNLDLRGRKGDMWDGGIRVPGIIEWPARIKPAVTDIPAGVVDIFPTLVDLLQLKVEHPVPLDGISLLPLLDRQMKARPQPLGFWQFAGDQKNLTPNSGPSAWNDNQYKLVKPKPGAWELYDIAADRTEQTNIAAKKPEIVELMKAGLEAWQQSVIRSSNRSDYLSQSPR